MLNYGVVIGRATLVKQIAWETGSRHNIDREQIKEEEAIDPSTSISCDCCEGSVAVPLSLSSSISSSSTPGKKVEGPLPL